MKKNSEENIQRMETIQQLDYDIFRLNAMRNKITLGEIVEPYMVKLLEAIKGATQKANRIIQLSQGHTDDEKFVKMRYDGLDDTEKAMIDELEASSMDSKSRLEAAMIIGGSAGRDFPLSSQSVVDFLYSTEIRLPRLAVVKVGNREFAEEYKIPAGVPVLMHLDNYASSVQRINLKNIGSSQKITKFDITVFDPVTPEEIDMVVYSILSVYSRSPTTLDSLLVDGRDYHSHIGSL